MTPSSSQLASFQNFILSTMGITPLYLPTDSIVIVTSLSIALEYVNQAINVVSSDLYNLALNNLAADFLIRWAPDQPGQTYFQNARTALGLNSLPAGVIRSAGDQGTFSSYEMANFYKDMNVFDLQNMQTIYGRQYMAIAQQFGTLWGLT